MKGIREPKQPKFAAGIHWPKQPKMSKDRGARWRTELRDQGRPPGAGLDDMTDAQRRAMFAALSARGGRRSAPRSQKRSGKHGR